MQEHTPPQAAQVVTSPDASPAHPAPQDAHDHAHERGPTPVGTFGIIGLLVLSISTLWLLVLGILEGRA